MFKISKPLNCLPEQLLVFVAETFMNSVKENPSRIIKKIWCIGWSRRPQGEPLQVCLLAEEPSLHSSSLLVHVWCCSSRASVLWFRLEHVTTFATRALAQSWAGENRSPAVNGKHQYFRLILPHATLACHRNTFGHRTQTGRTFQWGSNYLCGQRGGKRKIQKLLRPWPKNRRTCISTASSILSVL